MGYMTDFSFDIVEGKYDSDSDLEIIAQVLSKIRGTTVTLDDLEYSFSSTWYDYDKDMRELSKHFPDYVFELNGWGEDRTDLWRRWYRRGESQGGYATIIYPELQAWSNGV